MGVWFTETWMTLHTTLATGLPVVVLLLQKHLTWWTPTNAILVDRPYSRCLFYARYVFRASGRLLCLYPSILQIYRAF
jgi:hypothetical protein